MFVRRSLGTLPFGSDIFFITAAGVALAWAIHLFVAQFALAEFWSTACGIAAFVMAYAIAIWTGLLSHAEKGGILRALRSKMPGLSCNWQ
jgi:hypothetical protein